MNDTAFAEAMAHHQAGRLHDAAAQYRAILDREPDHADSLHLLGLITADSGDPHNGIALIRRAMALQPGSAVHYNSLGNAYRRLARPEDAVAAYHEAATLRPACAEIHNNLATALCDLERWPEAVTHYRQAAALAPNVADTWYNLANVLAKTDAPDTAACYRRALTLHPAASDTLGNYGRWLMTQGSWADANVHLTEAVRIAPTCAATWNNLGIVRRELGHTDAEACFRQALVLDPAFTDAHFNLGCLLSGHGRTDEAIACHQTALSIDPSHPQARLAACMAQLPILYLTSAEVAVRRQRYAEALAALEPAGLAAAVGTSQPFFLPYQGQHDRDLQAAYGQLVCRALAEPPAPMPPSPKTGERMRLGIVSGFFCDHTLFKLFLEGWLTQLDRTRFEIVGFHTGRNADAQTARSAALCDCFVQNLPSDAGWREAIAAAAPHVLLYPEVGIDPVAGRLAAQRLAPLQCAAWGQPVTTGMPTIDAFLSSTLMEPPDAGEHYTERLVHLPNLGLHYTPDDVAPPRLDRAALGLDPAAPVFWSGQALYKYLPQYDAVFPRIAAELGRCQFVFIAFAKSQTVTGAFHQRMSDAFRAAGLDAADHVVILPAMSQAGYIGAAGLADVILDTPGWSGGKSTLDCLVWNPAIVTLPGPFMRGRHTAAILRRISAEATIADSLDAYVSIAVRLARDPVWRAQVRDAVARGKHRAFNDRTYVEALETFLVNALLPSA